MYKNVKVRIIEKLYYFTSSHFPPGNEVPSWKSYSAILHFSKFLFLFPLYLPSNLSTSKCNKVSTGISNILVMDFRPPRG